MRYFCIQCFCNNPLVCRHVQRFLFVQCHPFDCILFITTFCIFMNRSSQYLTLCILDDIQTVVNRSLIASYETAFQTETDLCINRLFSNCSNTIRNSKVLQLNMQFSSINITFSLKRIYKIITIIINFSFRCTINFAPILFSILI